MTRRQTKQRHRQWGIAPQIPEYLLYKRLGRQSLWTSMCSGNHIPLGSAIDSELRAGEAPAYRVKHLVLKIASDHGVSTDAIHLLYAQRLLAGLRRRLDNAAQETLRTKGLRLRDKESLVHSTVRASLRVHSSQLSRRQQRMVMAWENMPATVVAGLQAATPQVSYRCTLDSDDLRLASHWPRDRRKSVEDEDSRLQSARQAEKAAMAYYRNLGYRVEDVSIQELLEGGPDHWETHDLEADGRPLDVKNVRCTQRHGLAEFLWMPKRNRNMEVPIVGVVSMDDSGESIVTGELQKGEWDCFREQVNRCTNGPRISGGAVPPHRSVPGWLLEYPQSHYASMPDWNKVLHRWMHISKRLETDVPPWIAALASSRRGQLYGAAKDTAIARTIHRYFQNTALSRRTLFWFVLAYMLSDMENRQSADEVAKWLFPEDTVRDRPATDQVPGRNFPLGLFDPRQYVWKLIYTLSQMIQSNRQLLATATGYRLRGLGILQGEFGNGWRTILAYCGNCGKWPIFLGEVADRDAEAHGDGACKSCPCHAKRLLCDSCGACAGVECTVEYETARDAQQAARQYPGWRQVGRELRRPDHSLSDLGDPDITPETHVATIRPRDAAMR